MAFIRNTRKNGAPKLEIVSEDAFTNLWTDFEFYLYVDEVYIYWKHGGGFIKSFYPLNDFLREGKPVNGDIMVDLEDLILLPNDKALILSYMQDE